MGLSFAHGAVQWRAADAATTTYPVTGLGFALKVTTGFDGLAYAGGFQTTIGYSQAYMAAMLAGVTAD